ncbi:CRISPR-associated endoribonuclease Cas6 [Tepidimicrobium xylanilyticum]|uniref:CRISPR-associated endoribonuclease n=1 Tax=Tepidimicrobium xylanilyticum TaxID=1123352 RepID=A0A1H2XEE2_9FIRM|nr:CRISPR-associated endoribonuclease Cas6 [Tepidimicrobium xylanilyticum]GMG97465.1 CRISPR-associated endoribonuclease Cas6 [Tepidimicrobium xylanilyticum]SDW90639.1 CRISPR-associated endoribonuclease Cas6 [Tepidimicrobium xylanilyticum]
MYLKITFSSINGQKIRLPLQYNYYVQSMIYKLLKEKMADFLHEKGFELGKRQFKMFCFSPLIGNYKILKETKEIEFNDQIDLYISSPMIEFLAQLSNSLLLDDYVILSSERLMVKNLEIKKESVKGDKVMVLALSPVTVYSTLYRPEGRKYTCYYAPNDKEFTRLISENIIKKYMAYYEKEPVNKEFTIKPIGNSRLHVLTYKGTLIKGYSGKFILQGDQSLIELALSSGLGNKNSQGFGFIKLLD